MLRLGSKYDFEHLREEALFRIRAEFPTTPPTRTRLLGGYTYITPRPHLLTDIINLALEQGLMSILPSAYFRCIQEDSIVSLLVRIIESFLNSLYRKKSSMDGQEMMDQKLFFFLKHKKLVLLEDRRF